MKNKIKLTIKYIGNIDSNVVMWYYFQGIIVAFKSSSGKLILLYILVSLNKYFQNNVIFKFIEKLYLLPMCIYLSNIKHCLQINL